MVFGVSMAEEKRDLSTTRLDGQFTNYRQLLEVVLRLKCKSLDAMEISFLNPQDSHDEFRRIETIKEYLKSYSSGKALLYYTKSSSFHETLNKALRQQNIRELHLLSSVIYGIQQAIKSRRSRVETEITVYRGQMMSLEEVVILQSSINQLITFYSFLSASKNREVAHFFVDGTISSNTQTPVIFTIHANSGLLDAEPFADITDTSNCPDEEEVLFGFGSIFRIVRVYRNADEPWNIEMNLCGNEEEDVKSLMKLIKKQIKVDIRSLGDVLKDMGKFYLAKRYLNQALQDLPADHHSRGYLYASLSAVAKATNDDHGYISYAEEARNAFEKRMDWSNFTKVAQLHNITGEINRRKGNFNIALKSYYRGLAFFRKADTHNHPRKATIYENISIVYQKQHRYLEALKTRQEALAIRQNCLPPFHFELGSSYYDIGVVQYCLEWHDDALESFKTSLTIRLMSLPRYHIDMGRSYRYIGLTYEAKGQIHHAIDHLRTALNTYQIELPSGHQDIVQVEQDIHRLKAKQV